MYIIYSPWNSTSATWWVWTKFNLSTLVCLTILCMFSFFVNSIFIFRIYYILYILSADFWHEYLSHILHKLQTLHNYARTNLADLNLKSFIYFIFMQHLTLTIFIMSHSRLCNSYIYKVRFLIHLVLQNNGLYSWSCKFLWRSKTS